MTDKIIDYSLLKAKTRETVMKTPIKNLSLLITFLAFVSLFLGAGLVLADDNDVYRGGGFTGPGAALSTAAAAKKMADDTVVTLRGNIVQSLGGEKYLFKDGSGEIKIEVDDSVWNGQDVGPQDLIEICGEIDKDKNKIEIDVDFLRKVAGNK